MALQRRASPGSSRWHASLAVLCLAVALAIAAIPAGPLRAVEADEAATDETRTQTPTDAHPTETQSDAIPADQPETSQPYAGDQPPPGVEVITVRRRALQEMATEVPSSLVQFDPKEIEALGAQDISDLARVTPNLEIKSLTATTPTFFIRGVGLNDFSANAAGAVAIYRDGVPLNAPAIQTGQLFDIAGVDVLRGPQGFDDNRNASAGAIHTRSREPTGSYEASLRADYGNYNATDFEGALEVPLVEEWLSARGSFRVTDRDPFYRNRCGNKKETFFYDPFPVLKSAVVCNESAGYPASILNLVPSGLPVHVNDRGRWGWRGLLRLTPPSSEPEMDWLLNVHGGKLDEYTPLGQTIGTAKTKTTLDGVTYRGVPANSQGYVDPDIARVYQQIKGENGLGDGADDNRLARQLTLDAITRDIDKTKPFENDYDLVGKETLKTLGTSLRGEVSLGPLNLTTTTGMERYRRKRAQDFDYSSNPTTHIHSQDKAWQATENLELEWELPPEWLRGVVRWGGFYLREELDSDSLFDLQLSQLVQQTVTSQTYTQDYDSLGAYANFSWDFLDDFTLDGGVRFNWEHKSFDMTAVNASPLPGVDNTASPASLKKTWSAPTGGIGLTYYFDPDVTAYMKYTRGWKGGHIQGNSIRSTKNAVGGKVTATPTVAEPETIDSFEIGARGSWLDNRLQLGGALFYYHYEDYQVFVIESQFGSYPTLKIINANDARVFGAEADIRAEPLRGWVPRLFENLTLSGRFGWIESEFLDFSDTRSASFPFAGQNLPINTTVDFTGNSLPNTPRFKFSGTVEYSLDLGRWGTPGLRYDLNWTDDIFFDPSEGRGVAENPFFQQDPLPEYAIGQKAYMLHDIRASYRLPAGNVELAFWCRNLTDERYKTFVADTTIAFDSLQNLIGEPRTYGGSISVFF